MISCMIQLWISGALDREDQVYSQMTKVTAYLGPIENLEKINFVKRHVLSCLAVISKLKEYLVTNFFKLMPHHANNVQLYYSYMFYGYIQMKKMVVLQLKLSW